MDDKHRPVLLNECIEALAIKPEGVYVDGTLGRAGHASEIVARLSTGLLIGIDRDEKAIEEAGAKLLPYQEKVKLVHGNFREIESIIRELGLSGVDGILLDLGVSSPQLDEAERGFSYISEAPLDMRMDRRQSLTAHEIVNGWTEDAIKNILFAYGEERYAPRIASQIIRRREKKTIETTLELAQIIRSAMPAAALREKQHPAKRSFQALRIAVNDELGAISAFLEAAVNVLKPGGRLALISFHSLEDRLVKNAIALREKGCTCPPDFPKCVCGFVQELKAVTRKPITPSPEEISENPRARSAKLRIAERV